MAARKSYKNDNFTKLRDTSKAGATETFTRDNVLALAKLQTACLRNNASYYGRKNRDSSITVRIYDGEDKYEETLGATEDWDLACEEMIEALWGLGAVALERRTLLAGTAGKPVEAQKQPNPTHSTGETISVNHRGS